MAIRSFAIAAVLMTSPAHAQTQGPTRSGYDPNERVCESIPVIGSRLAKRKVCATRAEWEEKRRLDREAIDQAQKQIAGPCQVAGNKQGGPSC